VTSSANVDLVRSIFAAWEGGDFTHATDWADRQIEWVMADGPAPGRWTGLAGMADSFRDFLSAWDEYRIEVEEYRELDDERVLVLQRFGGRAKMSGLEIGQMGQGASPFHLRGGKVIRIVNYFDREHALADLGLAREADAP
jgi:ketosteroid isomerase-like protein